MCDNLVLEIHSWCVRAFRGVGANSDHDLAFAKFHLKLKENRQSINTRDKFDTKADWKKPEVVQSFKIVLRNRSVWIDKRSYTEILTEEAEEAVFKNNVKDQHLKKAVGEKIQYLSSTC